MLRPRTLLSRAYSYLPTSAAQAILPTVRSKIWLDRGIIFIHIPRAAGTSINQALYGRFMGHSRASDIERWSNARVRALPRFSVTRNPWERLLSAYRYARRGSGIGDSAAGIWRPEQYHVPEFENFERFVLEWLAARNVQHLDFVFRPQWLWVHDRHGRLAVDHLGRTEDLAPTIAFIERILGPIDTLPWINRSGESLDYREMYTPETAALVRQIYRKDIELFGYEF